MRQGNGTDLIKVRFSIGVKLITIITFIVLISLGSIIALVSWLVRADLQIKAEETNLETNQRASMAAESAFDNILYNSMALIRTITSSGEVSALAVDSANFYFERNPNIASVFYSEGEISSFGTVHSLINESFFADRGIDSFIAYSYGSAIEEQLAQAANGDTFLLNAAAVFKAPVLALFFPWQKGGAVVLFAPMDISDIFGYGVNQSYLINSYGDILIHSDFSLVVGEANVKDHDFTASIFNNQADSAQTLYTGEDGNDYFGAFTKLETVKAVVITSIEYNKVFEGINATTRRNLYLTITVLSISIIFIWFFAKSISIPIRALAVAAHEIEEGRFDIVLRPKGHDEIGVLTASFQRMCKALGIFGRFTNRDIALRAMRGEIKPGGFPKHATVFFSDIRSFTSISENFTNLYGDEASDRIVLWLNKYFTRMVDCVERTKGVVDKFIGDAVMAHWGTAYTSGNVGKDAYNCISAAIMMRRSLQKLNKLRDVNDPGNPKIRIGCGINTGMVTAGQVGSDIRMEYTAIGDPVNLASRVESLNKTFGTDILITENTWRLVRRKFIVEEMPAVKVKGKEKPVRIFAVINYHKNPRGPKSLTRLRRVLGIPDPGNLRLVSSGSEMKKYKFIKNK